MDLTSLPAAWLRDNCGCALCRDPRNGQKLFQITDLPAELAVGAVRAGDTSFEVEWLPDGHRSVYTMRWLASSDAGLDEDDQDAGSRENGPGFGDGGVGRDSGDGRTEAGKQLWCAADLDGRLPEAGWEAYLADPAERIRVLESVQRLGFALLRDVPCAERQVLAVAGTFGHVRETNYGTLFDVRVEADPNNLAFTGAAIAPHTDNPYRDPVPTLQLLHCLTNAAVGGDSGLVDGFAAAALLRTEDPAAFEVLTRTLVPFRFDDARTSLRADRPLIEVDPLGRIREVRFNNRSIGTLRLSREALNSFYRAYRAFGALLLRPELRFDFRLAPGDCLVFDNTRLLHARTAFAESGERHLQGCYADLDGLASTLAVLRRERPLDELAALFDGAGAEQYLGEDVTQAQHMLQAASLAAAEGAAPSLVAAALLHDVGHFHGEVSGAELMAGTDNRHSHTGARWLARWFGPEVTEPVRLHVAAKRYLCAVEPEYFGRLSPASVHTLRVQGGPMSQDEVRAFEAEAFGADAVRLRRWDDGAKSVGTRAPGFAHYRPLLAGLLR